MRRRRSRMPIFFVIVFMMFFTLAFLRNGIIKESEAVSGFSAGNIISDYVMGNYSSMTVDEIQAFLDSKNSCDVPLSALSGGYLDGETYSITYASGRTYKWHVKDGTFVCMAKEKFGDGGLIGEGKTAAQLIYDFAQEYRINPQVILVILEKEQSLLSDGYPNNFDYGWALGFGAYDYGEWNTKYAGFKEQLRAAFDFYSWFLYEYDEDEAWWSYDPEQSEIYVRLGQSNILYNPDWECGYSSVNVENRATVALYVYTPYQPNEAALAAGSGTGDYCSSYGNRNFYNYFERWFGGIRDEGVFGWTEMVSPRAMKINRETMMVNPITKEIYENGATQIGDVYFFDSKIDLVWNNKNEVCLRTATDTEDKINRCIIMSRMEEVDNYYVIEKISQVKLIVENDTKKINLKTGKNVQDVPVEMYGEIVFAGKTVFNGKTYFQTKYDYEHNNEFFIPEDDLGNVKFIDFMYPRNLETNKSVVFYNLYTGEICKEVKGGYVKRYVTKTTVGESNYYQTEDDLGGNCAILSTDVSEINGAMDFSGLEFKDFMLPRELRTKVSTYSINVLDGTSCDVFYEKDETMMFTTKIQDYYRNEKDTKANIKCVIPSWKLAEVNEF